MKRLGYIIIVIDTVKKIWIGVLSFYIKQLTMNEAQLTNRNRDRADRRDRGNETKQRQRERDVVVK